MSQLTVDLGTRGEVVAQFTLLRAYDAAAAHFPLPIPITVKELVNGLYSADISTRCSSAIDEAILRGRVCYNHVIDSGDPFLKAYLAAGLTRGAMLRPAPHQEGFDFAIPLALEDGQLSGIFVQVKNNRSGRMDREVLELLSRAARKVLGGGPGPFTGALLLVLQLSNGEDASHAIMQLKDEDGRGLAKNVIATRGFSSAIFRTCGQKKRPSR